MKVIYEERVGPHVIQIVAAGPPPVQTIAIIGGSPGHYDVGIVTGFLQKLREKYPDATIKTGNHKGGEAQVREWCQLVEMKLDVVDYEYVGQVVVGCEVIVIIGTATGGVAKSAREWWHLRNLTPRNAQGGWVKNKDGTFASHLNGTSPVAFHVVGQPPKKARKPAEKKSAKKAAFGRAGGS